MFVKNQGVLQKSIGGFLKAEGAESSLVKALLPPWEQTDKNGKCEAKPPLIWPSFKKHDQTRPIIALCLIGKPRLRQRRVFVPHSHNNRSLCVILLRKRIIVMILSTDKICIHTQHMHFISVYLSPRRQRNSFSFLGAEGSAITRNIFKVQTL